MTMDALYCLLVNLNAQCWQMNGFDSFNSCSKPLSILFLPFVRVFFFVYLPIFGFFSRAHKEQNSFSRRTRNSAALHLSSVFCLYFFYFTFMGRKLIWLKFFVSNMFIYCVENGLKIVLAELCWIKIGLLHSRLKC